MKTVILIGLMFGSSFAQANFLESKLPSSVAPALMQRLVANLSTYNESADMLGNRKASLTAEDGRSNLSFPLSGDTRTKGQLLCARSETNDISCTVQDFADSEPLRNAAGEVRDYSSFGDYAASELFALLPVDHTGSAGAGMSKVFENVKCQVSRWSLATCQIEDATFVSK